MGIEDDQGLGSSMWQGVSGSWRVQQYVPSSRPWLRGRPRGGWIQGYGGGREAKGSISQVVLEFNAKFDDYILLYYFHYFACKMGVVGGHGVDTDHACLIEMLLVRSYWVSWFWSPIALPSCPKSRFYEFYLYKDWPTILSDTVEPEKNVTVVTNP